MNFSCVKALTGSFCNRLPDTKMQIRAKSDSNCKFKGYIMSCYLTFLLTCITILYMIYLPLTAEH